MRAAIRGAPRARARRGYTGGAGDASAQRVTALRVASVTAAGGIAAFCRCPCILADPLMDNETDTCLGSTPPWIVLLAETSPAQLGLRFGEDARFKPLNPV